MIHEYSDNIFSTDTFQTVYSWPSHVYQQIIWELFLGVIRMLSTWFYKLSCLHIYHYCTKEIMIFSVCSSKSGVICRLWKLDASSPSSFLRKSIMAIYYTIKQHLHTTPCSLSLQQKNVLEAGFILYYYICFCDRYKTEAQMRHGLLTAIHFGVGGVLNTWPTGSLLFIIWFYYLI